MAEKPKVPPITVQNPRYKGATPEEVAEALLRNWTNPPKPDDETPTRTRRPPEKFSDKYIIPNVLMTICGA